MGYVWAKNDVKDDDCDLIQPNKSLYVEIYLG